MPVALRSYHLLVAVLVHVPSPFMVMIDKTWFVWPRYPRDPIFPDIPAYPTSNHLLLPYQERSPRCSIIACHRLKRDRKPPVGFK